MNVVFNLEIRFHSELRKEKIGNEYSDAQIPFTKYLCHGVYIDSGERIIMPEIVNVSRNSNNLNNFSPLLDSNHSKYSMKSQKFGDSSIHYYKLKENKCCFFLSMKGNERIKVTQSLFVYTNFYFE